MAMLELTSEEMKALEEVLLRSISELTEEVGHTDSHDFREMLRHKKTVLEHLSEKVNSVVPA